MQAARLILMTALAVIVLTACGSRPPKLEPPIVKLVDLIVEPENGDFQLRVRLSNAVPRAMQIRDVRLEVRVDGDLLGEFKASFSGLLPGLGEEVLSLEGSASAPLLANLGSLGESSGAMLPLTIAGSLVAADDQSFDMDSKGWLSATPGRPWSFR